MPDPEIEFLVDTPTFEIREDVAFIHIDARDFAMRPAMAITFIEGAFRNIADWLSGKANGG